MADFDLNSIINSLSPEDMKNIQKMASSFLRSQENEPKKSEGTNQNVDLSSIISSLGGTLGGSSSGSSSGEGSQNLNLSMPDLSQISSLMPLLSAFNSHDERIDFINALRPLLSEGRRQKADEAVKLVRLLSVLPLLRERGLM